jgi:hypothetical protein
MAPIAAVAVAVSAADQALWHGALQLQSSAHKVLLQHAGM